MWMLVSGAFFVGFICLFLGLLCFALIQLRVSKKHGVFSVRGKETLRKFNGVITETNEKVESTRLGHIANGFMMLGTLLLLVSGGIAALFHFLGVS